MRNARFAPVRHGAPDTTDLSRLGAEIARLGSHRGYARSEIVSPRLLRFLPFRRQGEGPREEAQVMARLLEAGLDRKAIDYLRRNVAVELSLAESRASPGG